MEDNEFLSRLIQEATDELEKLKEAYRKAEADLHKTHSVATVAWQELTEQRVHFCDTAGRAVSQANAVDDFSTKVQFVSHCDKELSAYFDQEDAVTRLLVSYVERRFKDASQAAQSADEGYAELVNVKDANNASPSFEDMRKDLWRLEHSDAPIFEDLYQARAKERSTQAGLAQAKQWLVALQSGYTPGDMATLSNTLNERQDYCATLTRRIEEKLSQLRHSAEEASRLLPSTVIEGDYKRKLERQEAFLKRQDDLIRLLSQQKARRECLVGMLRLEAEHHRTTRLIMQATSDEWAAELEARIRRLRGIEDTRRALSRERQTAASNACAKALAAICEAEGEDAAGAIATFDDVEACLSQLAERERTAKDKIAELHQTRHAELQQLQSNRDRLEPILFGRSAAKDTSERRPRWVLPMLKGNMQALERHTDELTRIIRKVQQDQQAHAASTAASPSHTKAMQVVDAFFKGDASRLEELAGFSSS